MKTRTIASFDLCSDSSSGASEAFFVPGRNALLGEYEEVSCRQWSGSDGNILWNGACMAGENATFWGQPDNDGCPNTGTNHSLAHVTQFWLMYVSGTPPA